MAKVVPGSMYVPVQSGFTLYVPVAVSGTMLPFRLMVALVVTRPFPSKVSVPTPASGPAMAGGEISNPLAVCEKVPLRLALVHPLSAAFVVGDMPRASVVTAAIARVFAVVVRFIIIPFLFREKNLLTSSSPSAGTGGSGRQKR